VTDRIYTRTGDTGETGLFGGGRVRKDHPRVDAYGTVDELNAVIGWALIHARHEPTRNRLTTLQSDLFTIGAHLATPPPKEGRRAPKLPVMPTERAAAMERWMDEAEELLDPLSAFVLPGGANGAAALHLARTVCRRAERAVVTLAAEDAVDPRILVFLNRLSDYLFVAARLENRITGLPDQPWEPGSKG
jgi:cob(I)alamin adenosyltransferase